MKKILYLLFIAFCCNMSCDSTPIPEGGTLIINNQLYFGSGLIVEVYIDNTNHGIINYDETQTFVVTEGGHNLSIGAASGQGAIWSVDSWFKVSKGAMISLTIDKDGGRWE